MWQASNLLSHWFSCLFISLFGFCGLNPELEATGSDAELAKGFFRMNRLAQVGISIIHYKYIIWRNCINDPRNSTRKGQDHWFSLTNQNTLYLLHSFCSVIEIISVCSWSAISTLIGWVKSSWIYVINDTLDRIMSKFQVVWSFENHF